MSVANSRLLQHLMRRTVPRPLSLRAIQLQRRCLAQDASEQPRKSIPPIEPAEQPEAPKATLGTKAFAIVIGMGVALLYAAYKRRHAAVEKDGFVKFKLVEKEAVSSTTTIFTLRPVATTIRGAIDSSGGIYSVQLKQPNLQIARSYTMLPADGMDVRLLIKKDGEVSGYLHSLDVGADVQLRGPHKDYTFGDEQRVVFLAGGTGIAPALKVVDSVKAPIHVLWANKTREESSGGVSDTPPGLFSLKRWFTSDPGERNTTVLMLELAKRQGDVKVDYFVDPEKISLPTLDGSGTVFVSGPEGFIKYWAGAKEWRDGREVQGELGGVLGRMNLQNWKVVKL